MNNIQESNKIINRNTNWPLSYKIKRLLWSFAWFLFFRPTPKKFAYKWRNYLLQLFGTTIHGDCLICPTCRILEPWNLEIGDYSAVGERVNIYNYAKVTIGKNSVISQDTVLCTGTHDYKLRNMPLISKPITIGDEVWITSNCFIHPGVSIGNGTVVGACSVVIKDLNEWSIYSGNPAKYISNRFFLD